MSSLGQVFDISDMPDGAPSYEPVPEGWYFVSITGAEIKETKSGSGYYIRLRFDISGPTHQGRCVFANLNIKNSNPKAEEIARRDLAEIMRATGIDSLQDTDQLIGEILSVKVVISPGNDGYAASNDIRGYKSSENGTEDIKPIEKTEGKKLPWEK